MILLDSDVFVYYEHMPLTVRGVVSPNEDNTYTIYLNDRISDAQKLVTYIHEVRHIQNDDFYNNDDIETIERRADV